MFCLEPNKGDQIRSRAQAAGRCCWSVATASCFRTARLARKWNSINGASASARGGWPETRKKLWSLPQNVGGLVGFRKDNWTPTVLCIYFFSVGGGGAPFDDGALAQLETNRFVLTYFLFWLGWGGEVPISRYYLLGGPCLKQISNELSHNQTWYETARPQQVVWKKGTIIHSPYPIGFLSGK